MKHYLCLAGLIIIAFGCNHKDEVHPGAEVIPGGTGGNFNIAVFPVNSTTGITGKCFIKYACKEKPNPVVFDDSLATMTEPGFGPHAHFMNLKAGFYFVSAMGKLHGNTMKGDTLIEVKDTQALSVDFDLQVK